MCFKDREFCQVEISNSGQKFAEIFTNTFFQFSSSFFMEAHIFKPFFRLPKFGQFCYNIFALSCRRFLASTFLSTFFFFDALRYSSLIKKEEVDQ